MNKNFLIAGGVLLVIGFAVAVGVTLSSEPVTAGLPEGEVTVTGDPLPVFAGENDDNVSIGLTAPTFSAPNENSEIVSLEKNGNAKALIFLAHWCGFCQEEVPSVQEWIDTIGVPEGIEIIAVATSIDRARNFIIINCIYYFYYCFPLVILKRSIPKLLHFKFIILFIN